METLRLLQNRIDELSLRERGIILAGIIVIMYFLFDAFLMQPLAISQKKTQNRIVSINNQVIELNMKIQQVVAASPAGRQEKKMQEVQRLRQENNKLDQELQLATANLVTPRQMTRLLQSVLERTDGLHLRKVTSLGANPLVLGNESVSGTEKEVNAGGEGGNTESEKQISTVYKHGLQIEFDGNFFATLDYLRKLEQLEWKFIWDDIKYEVTEYPDARTVLSLYTISLDKNWIGV